MKLNKNEEQWHSNPEEVDGYMQKLDHPLLEIIEALRKIILSTDKEIGEHIKWNAPSFFYTGEIKPFNPKEYKRYIIVFNLFKKDCIRLVFPSGAKVNDASGLLEGDYNDGRRLALFYTMDDVRAKEKAMRQVIKTWLQLVEK
jgi:hypothetical protein